MEAEDILNATHKLEETGMTRSQSEAIAKTIIAAVEPLDVRADLEATKADVKSIKEQMATKADLAVAISSVKVWYLVTLLSLFGALLAIDAL